MDSGYLSDNIDMTPSIYTCSTYPAHPAPPLCLVKCNQQFTRSIWPIGYEWGTAIVISVQLSVWPRARPTQDTVGNDKNKCWSEQRHSTMLMLLFGGSPIIPWIRMGAMGGDANSMLLLLLLLVRERVLFGRRPKIQRTLHRCRRVSSAAAAVTLLHTEEGICYVPLPPPPPLLLHCPCMAVMSWQ